MAPKSKKEQKEAAPAKTEEPPAKKPKTDEAEATEAKEEEKKEKEVDAPKDARAKFAKPITFEPNQTTLNVIPTLGGKVLMATTDGGAQFLIAGAKASAGMKAGRYMFEVQVIEALGGGTRQRGQGLLVKVGVSTQESSLFLGDEGTVCFDSDGGYVAESRRQITGQRFGKDSVIGLVVNLDEKSPNFNTVSLFKNGVRAGEPMGLPEAMKGKPLFPSVNFRAASLQVHFGPEPLAKLPFTCTTLAGAAKSDVVEIPAAAAKDGKCEVVFPVGKPDEGTFDFLDIWMEQNPGYIELSERKMQEWAVKSGMWRGKNSWKNSNDKPDWSFGLPAMDDRSAVRVLNTLAPLVPRNYVVMEVKQNLVKADREINLKRFPDGKFTKTALVAMGEPDKDFKGKVHKKVLENKQARMTLEWNRKKQEKAQKKKQEKRQKQLAEMQKKAEEKKKEMEEAKKKAEEEKKAQEEAKEGEEKKEEAKDDEAKGEAKEEVKKEATEEVKEEKKDMEVDAETKKEETEVKEEEETKDVESEPEEWEKTAPVAELTDEEKAVNFKTPVISDLNPQVLGSAFGNFSLPDKSEGFKKITFKWFEEKKAKEYLRDYVLKTKLTARVEDLQPGEWFKTKFAEFEKSKKEWEEKLKEYLANKGEKKEDEEKKDIDLASVEDVSDVGNGEPLYSGFVYEDWALFSLRYELYLMVASFKKDVNDDERPGIHESHIGYYYAKYFRKQISPKFYAKESIEGVLELVKDLITLDTESKVLETTITEEPETAAVFVKQTEKHRRERQRRIDAGDDTAKLKFMEPQPQKVYTPPAAPAAAATPAAAPAAATLAAPAVGKPVMPPQQHKQWANQGHQGGNWGNQGQQGGNWGNRGQQGQQGQQGGNWGKAAKGGGKGWGGGKGGDKGGYGGGGRSWGK